MSHFARVENGIVTDVIVAEQDFIDSGAIGDPSLWIQTSFNTKQNVHYDPITSEPDGKLPFRGNYAGIGYIYDKKNDVFYAQQPYPSWTLSTDTWSWVAPVPYPESVEFYIWNESSLSWDEIA